MCEDFDQTSNSIIN